MAQIAFVTGIARSGTNLIGRMLAQHQDFAFAMDPFLPVFKWFRSSVVDQVRRSGSEAVPEPVPPSAPIDDYYFHGERQRLMEAISGADFRIPFDDANWPLLQKDLEGRAIHESADLVPYLSELKAPTYASIWQAGMNLVAKHRGKGSPLWVGVKELWCVEFIPHLLKAFPSAKAVVIVRDPRAVVASMLKMGEDDVTQQAQILSYVRHWRKLAAFLLMFLAMPAMADRLFVVRYEDLVKEPENKAQELCMFFGVGYDPSMLDMAGFYDPSRKAVWQGNSSFKTSIAEVDADLANRWETYLPELSIRLIDFLAGADMRLFGYEPRTGGIPGSEADIPLEAFVGSYGAQASWRSDSGDLVLDMGLEIARRSLLASPTRPNEELIKQCFLFTQVYDNLKKTLGVQVGTPVTKRDTTAKNMPFPLRLHP